MSQLNFEVIGSRPEPYHASPTLSLQLRITETTGARLHAIALRCQVQIEPRRRRYAPDEEERLLELFGERRRWSETLQTIVWAQVPLMVQGFTGQTEVDLPDEGVEREITLPGIPFTEVLDGELLVPMGLGAGREVEMVRGDEGEVAGRIVRERWPVAGLARVSGEAVGRVVRVRVRIENLGLGYEATGSDDRNQALRHSLVRAHTLLALRDGAFVSLLDPPEWAAEAVASCVNLHTWPVLVGEQGRRDVMLSSPVILSDYPQVAAESPGDLSDATAGLNFSLDPEADASPSEASVTIGGIPVSKGSHVWLRPSRRADTMEMFLAGRPALVEGVYRDVDDEAYVAVSLEGADIGDPETPYGRFLCFYPDEIEPLDVVAEPPAHDPGRARP